MVLGSNELVWYMHRRTGQYPFVGQTEFFPKGERELFVMRPRRVISFGVHIMVS